MQICKIIVMLWFVAVSALAQAAVSDAEIEKFVEDAADYIKTAGKDAALKEFSDPNGKFSRGELYIYCYDFSGILLAHGAMPEQVGENHVDLQDAKGEAFVRKLIKKAFFERKGWVSYAWENPAAGKVMTRMDYVLKANDYYWLGAGKFVQE